MGMFSFRCRGCGHPMLSHGTTSKINHWMKNVVALTPEGDRLMGEYDGYGRVEGMCYDAKGRIISECESDFCYDTADWWHKDCWEKKGRPKYQGRALNARDQGFVFEDGDHDMAKPTSEADVDNGREASDEAEKKCCEMWKRVMEKESA